MAKISQREKILLGYNPNSLSNSSSRRNSEVDFSDVFGGPPRCSSSTQEYYIEIDRIEAEEDDYWFGLREKPVFGDQIGARKRCGSDDFYDDIFRGDQPSFSCSLSPRVHISPSRPSTVVEPFTNPSKFSLSGRSTNTDIMTLTSLRKFFGRSLSRFNHITQNHSTLNGDDARSYQPSSLSRQISIDEEDLTRDSSKVTGITDQHEPKFIMQDSKVQKFANDNIQFHFSIYKWANKGVPIVMSSRKRSPSRSNERLSSDSSLVMENINGYLNANEALSMSKLRMPSAQAIEPHEHIDIAECKLLDGKFESCSIDEVGEPHCEGLVVEKEVLDHSEKGLVAWSIKHSSKMKKFNLKPRWILFGQEKEGNIKANTIEKGPRQSKQTLKTEVYPSYKADRKCKAGDSSTGKTYDFCKGQVPGTVKDFVKIFNKDSASQVKSDVSGQNNSRRWKDTFSFDVLTNANTFPFPTNNHDEKQDSYANLVKPWSESKAEVHEFLSVEQEYNINGSVTNSASNN
ncbi:J domain-containing protein required for chloroplast accumulation response 1, partial [Bienertia sinuspersici]